MTDLKIQCCSDSQCETVSLKQNAYKSSDILSLDNTALIHSNRDV